MNELANEQVERNGVYAPDPRSAGARTILFDNGSNVRLLNQLLGLDGGTTADAGGYADGVVPASQTFASELPNPSELPHRAKGLPGSRSSANAPEEAPQYGYGLPASEGAEPAGTPPSMLTSQLPASMSQSVWPTATALSSGAFLQPHIDPWPLRGNGILGGYRPASAGGGILGGLKADSPWLTPSYGILGPLTQPSAGGAGSVSPQRNDNPSWMLPDLWSGRMQDDAGLDDSNR